MLHSGMAAACVLLLGAVVPASAQIAVHFVPGEFATIQEALDASSDGDVIVVWPGTWTGRPHPGRHLARRSATRFQLRRAGLVAGRDSGRGLGIEQRPARRAAVVGAE